MNDAPTRIEYLVRRALLVDVPTLADIHVRAWRESYRGIVSDAALDRLSVERRALQHAERIGRPLDDSATYVAIEPGRSVVGFGVCGPRRSGPPDFEGEFYALYLLDRAKGQGLGRRLMAHMADWLVSRGLSSAFVLALKENQPARRFYERLGGVECFDQPFTLQGESYREIGYGWRDVSTLSRPPAPQIGRSPDA